MLRISFAPPRELVIEGTRVDFRQLTKALHRIGSNALDSIDVAADATAEAEHGTRVLRELRVSVGTGLVGPGLVRIGVEDGHAVATGSRSALAKLATWFEFDPAEVAGSVRRHESGADSEWIDASACSFRVQLAAGAPDRAAGAGGADC